MTTDEKLAAILAAVQTDPGHRGLARDPHDNLFTACPGDFAAACRCIATAPDPDLWVVTGFYIPSASPPTFETDGPLGAVFLKRSLVPLGIRVRTLYENRVESLEMFDENVWETMLNAPLAQPRDSHLIALERAGPGHDGRCRTMRGIDITDHLNSAFNKLFAYPGFWKHTIGIGDGGNEIGMGKVPHETIVKNIPNGDLIHCRVATDFLLVAGVSNWGAYALAAGVYVLREATPPADLFDPDREREILEVMVREGPLVDGVTGKQTATVDGLTWEEYAKPLVRIREILEA